MANTVIVNPLTRISGFLEIKAEVENGIIRDAKSSGLLFRGFERMLQGRAPLDAIYFTQRICGICSTAHSLSSSLALEAALNVQPDINSRIIREFVHGCEFIQNHLRHFYQYTLPDYIKGPDINPLYAVTHKDFRLPKYLNEELSKHYVESLEFSRSAHDLLATLGGKAPHNHGVFVGGITSNVDTSKLEKLKYILGEIRQFVEAKAVEDCNIIGQYYPEYYHMGVGDKNLMTYGVFNYPEYKEIYYTGQGVYIDGKLEAFDSTLIDEDIQKAWYTAENNLNKPEGPYTEEDVNKQGAYSWVKAPRYKGRPMETGPLARMFISGGYTRGISAMDRTMARVLELRKVIIIMQNILELIPEYQNKQTQYQIPDKSYGRGLIDTTRGALGHWIAIDNKVLKNYSIITPSAWNLSPQDNKGIRGPVESALVGTRIDDLNSPVEIGRIVRSFDPCVSCATHVYGKNHAAIEIRLM
jgi:hydrogenase large subunit